MLMSSPCCVVDSISKPWRVYNGEPQFDSFLLDADGVLDNVDRLTDPFCIYVPGKQRCHKVTMHANLETLRA